MTATTLERPSVRARFSAARIGGATIITGALIMLTGTAIWAASGADLDAALDDGSIAAYLTDAASSGTALTLNLGFWILGVLTMGAGGLLLSRLGGDSAAAAIARAAFTAGPAAAVVFFSVWLGIVLGLAPAHVAGESVAGVAVALGHAVSIADWVATVVILSVGGGALALAGRDTWVPRWLMRWAVVVVAAGALAIVGLVVGARSTIAMPVVPIGIAYLIAAGVAAIRHDG